MNDHLQLYFGPITRRSLIRIPTPNLGGGQLALSSKGHPVLLCLKYQTVCKPNSSLLTRMIKWLQGIYNKVCACHMN